MTDEASNNEGSPDVRAVAGVAAGVATAYNAAIAMRVNLSMEFLWAARHMAGLALHEEQAPGDLPRSTISHRSYVLNAIMDSVGFMEAAINEVLEAGPAGGSLSEQTRARFTHYWKKSQDGGKRHTPLFDKYDTTLLIAGKNPLDRSRNAFANAQLVVELRNWAVHYTPEWYQSDVVANLGRKLAGRFPLNAMMKGAGNPVFPYHVLGAGCAKWAHESAVALVGAWADALGIELVYQTVHYEKTPGTL